jgi:hypothetical protein
MNTTKLEKLRLKAQETLHRMTREEVAEMSRLAEHFAHMRDHDSITVTDARYAAWAVIVKRAATAFPASPATGQLCFRSDLDVWYRYDGAAWQQTTGAAAGRFHAQ